MLERLGFRHFAYDWHTEHIPTFDAEIDALKHHGVSLDAFWVAPGVLNRESRIILDVLKRHGVQGAAFWVLNDLGGDRVAGGGRQRRVAAQARWLAEATGWRQHLPPPVTRSPPRSFRTQSCAWTPCRLSTSRMIRDSRFSTPGATQKASSETPWRSRASISAMNVGMCSAPVIGEVAEPQPFEHGRAPPARASCCRTGRCTTRSGCRGRRAGRLSRWRVLCLAIGPVRDPGRRRSSGRSGAEGGSTRAGTCGRDGPGGNERSSRVIL